MKNRQHMIKLFVAFMAARGVFNRYETLVRRFNTRDLVSDTGYNLAYWVYLNPNVDPLEYISTFIHGEETGEGKEYWRDLDFAWWEFVYNYYPLKQAS